MPSNADDIFLTTGASNAIRVIFRKLKSVINNSNFILKKKIFMASRFLSPTESPLKISKGN